MIPPLLHFIWISLGDSFPDLYRLCILSAVIATKCKVILHTDDPTIELPGVEICLRTFPTTINGVPFVNEDVDHYNAKRVSHLKDVVRLEILYQHGGIYSDLDVLWLRDPWHLLHNKVVIGFQSKARKTLCNAIMMAESKHQAISDYLNWTVRMYPPKKYWIPANPYKVWETKSYRKDLTYLGQTAFFPRRYSEKKPFTIDLLSKSVAIHLYSSMERPMVGSLIDLFVLQIKERFGLEIKI